jgi:hypothetical protein
VSIESKRTVVDFPLNRKEPLLMGFIQNIKHLGGRVLRYQLPQPVYPAIEILERIRDWVVGPAHPLNCSEDFRPFFIIGSGRCGTTLLRRILQASPEIHIPPETYGLEPAAHVYRRGRNKPWPHLVTATLAQYEFSPHFDTFGISLRSLARELEAVPAQERSLALIIHKLYEYHGHATGQTFTRWGDKTPYNTFLLPLIPLIFPKAQYIHMLRDGADVAHSFLVSGLNTDLAAPANRWRVAVTEAESFVKNHPQVACTVRYEDLVAAPMDVMSRLCGFLGIGFSESMLNDTSMVETMGDVSAFAHHAAVKKPISAASVGKGRRALTDDQRKQLQALIGPELALMGYAPATDQ